VSIKPSINPVTAAESIDYGRPQPRCTLDMVIRLDDGTIIDDSLMRLQTFSGNEGISQPFEFNLETRVNDFTSSGNPQDRYQSYGENLSGKNPQRDRISFAKFVGSSITVRLGLPQTSREVENDHYPGSLGVSYFNGIVTSFAMANRGVYHLEVKPSLVRLGFQSHYRLFSQKTILEVIGEVLHENKISFTSKAISEASLNTRKSDGKIIKGLANYRRQDWLQAGETDLDFVNRLMESANLFYYFVHSDTTHLMVLTDQNYYQPIRRRALNSFGRMVETDQVKPLFLSYTKGGQEREDFITEFKFQQNLTTDGVSTILAQKEATWKSQNTAQVAPVYRDQSSATRKLNMEQMHVVSYGASEREAEIRTSTAVKKIIAGTSSLTGSSGCSELKAGYVFEVQETFENGADRNHQLNSSPIRPELNGRQFVALTVSHQASADGSYSNQFSSVDAAGIATSFDASGDKQGTVLAIVADKPSGGTTRVSGLKKLIRSMIGMNTRGSKQKYLEKTAFAFDQKDFRYELPDGHDHKNTDKTFSCRGLYVRFVSEASDSTAQWVKLAEHMTTVPEIGSYVVIGRSSDETEVPEVQQSLEAKGSLNIMPEKYTTNTSVGDSYSTNYGNSSRVSFGGDASTSLSEATSIVEAKRKSTNKYNDVSYSESKSFNYGVTKLSHQVSTAGIGSPLPADDPDGYNEMDYVQYSRSIMYGDSYSKSETFGDSHSFSDVTGNNISTSVQTGNTTSTSTQNGDSTNDSTQNGDTHSTSYVCGYSRSSSTNWGDTRNISENHGDTYNNSTNYGDTHSESRVTGASTSYSRTGSTTNTSFTGASNNNSVTGISNNNSATAAEENISATGFSRSVSMTANSKGLSVTGYTTSAELIGGGISYKNKGALELSAAEAIEVQIVTMKMII
jgi:uncharacterized protein involved in type VI secretion and phage assembly